MSTDVERCNVPRQMLPDGKCQWEYCYKKKLRIISCLSLMEAADIVPKSQV